MKKDLFLEYYVIKNIANKLNKNEEVKESDYAILKEFDRVYDRKNNIIYNMVNNDTIASYSDYIELLDILSIVIYDRYGILL